MPKHIRSDRQHEKQQENHIAPKSMHNVVFLVLAFYATDQQRCYSQRHPSRSNEEKKQTRCSTRRRKDRNMHTKHIHTQTYSNSSGHTNCTNKLKFYEVHMALGKRGQHLARDATRCDAMRWEHAHTKRHKHTHTTSTGSRQRCRGI